MTAPAAPPGLDLLLRGGIALTSDPSCPVIEDAVIGVRGDRLALVASAASAPPRAVRSLLLISTRASLSPDSD